MVVHMKNEFLLLFRFPVCVNLFRLLFKGVYGITHQINCSTIVGSVSEVGLYITEFIVISGLTYRTLLSGCPTVILSVGSVCPVTDKAHDVSDIVGWANMADQQGTRQIIRPSDPNYASPYKSGIMPKIFSWQKPPPPCSRLRQQSGV